jgi:hypothetical protein
MNLVSAILLFLPISFIIGVYKLSILKEIRDKKEFKSLLRVVIKTSLLFNICIYMTSFLLLQLTSDDQIKEHWGANEFMNNISPLWLIKGITQQTLNFMERNNLILIK